MRRRTDGFTLVEILIALVVIGLGVAAMMMFQGRALKESSAAAVRAEAAGLAAKQLADLQSNAAPAAFASLMTNSDQTSAGNHVMGKTAQYTRTWVVTPRADGSKQVEVTVSWADGMLGANGGGNQVVASGVVQQTVRSMPTTHIDLNSCTANGHSHMMGDTAMHMHGSAQCAGNTFMGMM